MLPEVSRTFALGIRLLPPSLSFTVSIAYLICRIADTIEDNSALAVPVRRALLAELADLAPRRALIIRGEGGREFLGEALRSRGTVVEYLECYRRLKPARDMRELLSGPIRGNVKACTATSANIVVNLFEMAGVAGGSWLQRLPFFVSHARVAATAFSRGVQTVFVTGNGDDALVAGLTSWFARTRERASL